MGSVHRDGENESNKSTPNPETHNYKLCYVLWRKGTGRYGELITREPNQTLPIREDFLEAVAIE